MCLDPVRVTFPQVGGGMFSQIFKRKRSTVGWVLDGWNAPRSEGAENCTKGAENCTEGAENLRNERKTVQNGRKTVQNGRKTGSVTRIRVAATVSCCLGRMTFSGPVRVDN